MNALAAPMATVTQPVRGIHANRRATVLAEAHAACGRIRSSIAEVFSQLSGFVLGTARDIRSFDEMMRPYIAYFYSVDAANPDSFLGDVVLPSRDEMVGAVNRAVAVMQGDEDIYNAISRSIESTLTLRDSIDAIIDVIEEIEIYFLNTMIVSIKAGAEGQALTKISQEIGQLSSATCALSAHFKDQIQRLDGEFAQFKRVRGDIAVFQENRLTQMTLDIKFIFLDMVANLQRLSGRVDAIMTRGREIETLAHAYIARLQMEDLFQQNIDKAAHLIEEYGDGWGGDNADAAEASICARMLSDKFGALADGTNELCADFTSLTGMSRDLAADVLLSIKRSGADGSGETNLDDVYERVERMRDEFVTSIERIIEHKNEICTLSERIQEIVGGFDSFFRAIAQLTRKFEVINMLTRIEIARNANIAGLQGGALAAISLLPQRIKRSVAEAEALYDEVKARIDGEIVRYRSTIEDQAAHLADITASIRKVSVKLFESRKYYEEIVSEIERSVRAVLAYVNGDSAGEAKLSMTTAALVGIREALTDEFGPPIGDLAVRENAALLRALQERLTTGRPEGEYARSMLQSFFNEYLEESVGDDVTFF